MTFKDEDGNPHQFTWRTISTWLYRYKSRGVTAMTPKTRSDKGRTRKVSPEAVLEAIEQVLPLFRGKHPAKAHLYRACLEKGILRRDRVAPNTFSRLVNQYEMLKPDREGMLLALAWITGLLIVGIVGVMLESMRLPGAARLGSVPMSPAASVSPGPALKSPISLFSRNPAPGTTIFDP